MYPFRILLVRKDDDVFMRVVYQRVRHMDSIRINTRDIVIQSSACPEWGIHHIEPTIYLRGWSTPDDHRSKEIYQYKPTDELIEKINNDLKLIYEEINRLNQLSYAS